MVLDTLDTGFMAEAAGLLSEEFAIADWYLINQDGRDFQNFIIT